jgi:hypothetical protein
MGQYPNEVHIDAVLTNYAYEYTQGREGFIGDQVAPALPVTKQSDKYYVGDKSAFTIEDYKRAPTADYPYVEWSHSTDSYFCDSFGIAHAEAAETLYNADAQLRLGQKATRNLANKFQMAYEKRVADTFFNETNFTNGGTLTAGGTGAGYQWSDYTNGTPIEDILDAVEAVANKIFVPANTLVISRPGFRALRMHPDVIAALYGDGPQGIPTKETIADYLGLARILVGSCKYNAAGTLTDIWGDYASVCYLDPAAGEGLDQVVCPLRTFVWTVDGVGRYQISQPEYVRSRKSYVWYGDDYTDEKIISVDAV